MQQRFNARKRKEQQPKEGMKRKRMKKAHFVAADKRICDGVFVCLAIRFSPMAKTSLRYNGDDFHHKECQLNERKKVKWRSERNNNNSDHVKTGLLYSFSLLKR